MATKNQKDIRQMKIAIVILNYNSSSDCAKCISFLKLQQGAEFEIVVVDNRSSEDDLKSLHNICDTHGCTLLVSNSNSGYSAGNNIGLKYAANQGYEYVLIANPDIEFPQHDYIAHLVKQMETDNDIVAIGSDVVGPDGVHQNPMFAEGNWTSSFDWVKGFFNHKKEVDKYFFIDNYQQSHYCQKLSGCCLMLSIKFLKETGWFDEYPFMYCEEAILSKQVSTNHKKMYYTADVQAVHRHIKSEKGNPIWRFRQWRRSRLYFIEKYSGDNILGRFIAKCSIRFYIFLMITACKLKGK